MARVSRLPKDPVSQWATENVTRFPREFTSALGAAFGVSRAAAATAVRRLEAEGYVVRTAGSTRPAFAPGPTRWLSRNYALPGIDEQDVWERDFMPWIQASPNVLNILHHGFTEIVNNANDHSGGSRVQVEFFAREDLLSLGVADDGVGVFRKIADTLQLPDPRLALLELAKGKFTSDASQHSGEGIFFTSRMFDAFYLDANELAYHKYNGQAEEERLESGEATTADRAPHPIGTGVMMFIGAASTRTTREVFERFTPDIPDDFSFARTVVPVRLATLGAENLLSRSQAKRLVARVDKFKLVELDFDGVDEIGQAFADEVFRVFANAHPDVQLIARNAVPYVAGMIARVRGDQPRP